MGAALVIVGGGRMGEALVEGLLRGGHLAPEELVVAEKLDARRTELAGGIAGRFPGLTVAAEPVAAAGGVVAVKPTDVEEACRLLAGAGVPRVLSIAAGVPLHRLERWLGGRTAVVRAMPNTPALVGAGAAAVAPGRHAGADDVAWAEEDPRRRRHRGPGRGAPARRRHRPLGLGARLRLPRCRGTDRGGCAGRPFLAGQSPTGRADPARRRSPARRVERRPRVPPGVGHLAGRDDGGRPTVSRGGGRAQPPSSTR